MFEVVKPTLLRLRANPGVTGIVDGCPSSLIFMHGHYVENNSYQEGKDR